MWGRRFRPTALGLQYPVNLSARLRRNGIQAIMGMNWIEVPDCPPMAEQEKTA